MLDFIFVSFGLLLLVAGGEGLVRGASGIALRARLSPAVVGLTIVAAGTSMPELVVSVQSAWIGRPGLAVGNVVGSNIFNIGAIVGLAALVHPLRIQGNTLKMEWPVMMLASLQLGLLARDGAVDRLEGSFLFAAMIVFTTYAVWVARHAITPEERAEFDAAQKAPAAAAGPRGALWDVAWVLLGVAGLAVGSSLLVHGAVGIAQGFGVSEAVIGLTIVAAGTSTPELVTSLVAARRGQDDIAVANVVGSNIFNILGILGLTAVIHPLEVPAEILNRDLLWMLGAAVALFPLMWTGLRVSRVEGALLTGAFAIYLTLLIRAV